MNNTLYEALKEYFPHLRLRLQALDPPISEANIARHAGMHPTQLSRLINHPSDVRVSTVLRLEQAFNTLSPC